MSRVLIAQTVNHLNETVEIAGHVDTKRDHGKVTFIDLRDESGKMQIVGYQMLSELKTEAVISVKGKVKKRPASQVNSKIATGELELEVENFTILGNAQDLPILIDDDGYSINEEMRLKYRYLDLRRERLQKNIRLRHQLIKTLRENLYQENFLEIETPILTQSTREGARDFIVPSRLSPGNFYALPQSPQQYKQLLIASGFEKYFQVARCFRDEDLRADRLLELTQLDLEMAYVDKIEQVMQLVEKVVKNSLLKMGVKLQSENFPHFTYAQAMKKFGADRFDLRSEEEKKQGVLAFAWVRDFPFFKKVDSKDQAEVEDGKSGWTFTHNPFSAPLPEYTDDLLQGKNIANILTAQYDLVCNGYEVGGGSLRAHRGELLEATYKIMGYNKAQIQASIGHLLQAFSFGVPPHGGIALGIDRLAMVIAGETSVKEVVAFPTSGSGKVSVMNAPNAVSPQLLKQLNLTISQRKDK